MARTVAIIGGGPVGLTLACLLTQAGIDCHIYEARQQRSPHSRAIGIHPPAQRVLEAIGVLSTLQEEAVSVSSGRAFYGTRPLGVLALPAPVLSLPQTRTEELLEARLQKLNPDSLRVGAAITDIATLQADFIVGCDGKNSTVRQQAGMGWEGGAYPDTYLMGDFADDTEFGDTAIICLTAQGLVESFPLPGKKRRWVAWCRDVFHNPSSAEQLSVLTEARIGRCLPIDSCTWISPFGIERFLASQFARGNVALAGDAAHIVSPIGGQGMNLGLLDAEALAAALVQIVRHGADPNSALRSYEAAQKRRAVVAGRQAALNTCLGRPCGALSLQVGFVNLLLSVSPLSRTFARKFTMLDC